MAAALDNRLASLMPRVGSKTTPTSEVTSMASSEQWLEALQPVYDPSPKNISTLRCPNCGARELRLCFYTYNPKWRPHGAFWCSKCLQGVALGPCVVPAAYKLVRHEDAN